MSYAEDYAKSAVTNSKTSFEAVAHSPFARNGVAARSATTRPSLRAGEDLSTQVDENSAKNVFTKNKNAVAEKAAGRTLYTPEQRRRRDATAWTLVQGILAPVQFAILLVSLGCVVHFLLTGRGLALATGSVVVKTVALYAIMVTGSIWEKMVFGRYLFAPAFLWEDVVSMLVLALHTAYLGALATGTLGPHGLMGLALAAYASYVVNAGQFVLKLRAARLQGSGVQGSGVQGSGVPA